MFVRDLTLSHAEFHHLLLRTGIYPEEHQYFLVLSSISGSAQSGSDGSCSRPLNPGTHLPRQV